MNKMQKFNAYNQMNKCSVDIQTINHKIKDVNSNNIYRNLNVDKSICVQLVIFCYQIF